VCRLLGSDTLDIEKIYIYDVGSLVKVHDLVLNVHHLVQ
jgi:hypothetical protein